MHYRQTKKGLLTRRTILGYKAPKFEERIEVVL